MVVASALQLRLLNSVSSSGFVLRLTVTMKDGLLGMYYCSSDYFKYYLMGNVNDFIHETGDLLQ